LLRGLHWLFTTVSNVALLLGINYTHFMNHVGSSVNLCIVKDNKILLLRRISQKWMDGKLQVPGGHTEPGESPLQAVLREAHEELGIAVGAADVRHFATLAVKDGDNEYFALQFELLVPENFTFRIMEPHKCSELVWSDLENLSDDTIDLFRHVVEHGLVGGQSYIEVGY